MIVWYVARVDLLQRTGPLALLFYFKHPLVTHSISQNSHSTPLLFNACCNWSNLNEHMDRSLTMLCVWQCWDTAAKVKKPRSSQLVMKNIFMLLTPVELLMTSGSPSCRGSLMTYVFKKKKRKFINTMDIHHNAALKCLIISCQL